MKDFYRLTCEETLTEVRSQPNGLTETEANERLRANGANKLETKKKTPAILRFLKQLADPMIVILLVAAIVSLVLTVVNNADPANEKESFADVIIISVVVLLNATLGVVQEGKAEKALESLQTLTKSQCKIMRDGAVRHIENDNLVVGDIVLLEAGDRIPADCRILESASCKAEESALTGESVPVDKRVSEIDGIVTLGDRKNMLYMGSSVAYGRAKAVVCATGMSTEMGKIANILDSAKEEKTPLQRKMAQLSKILTFAVIGISLFIFGFNLIKNGFGVKAVMNSLFIAIGLAVASIPEGLATVVKRRNTAFNGSGNVRLLSNYMLRQNGYAYAKRNDRDGNVRRRYRPTCKSHGIMFRRYVNGQQSDRRAYGMRAGKLRLNARRQQNRSGNGGAPNSRATIRLGT